MHYAEKAIRVFKLAEKAHKLVGMNFNYEGFTHEQAVYGASQNGY